LKPDLFFKIIFLVVISFNYIKCQADLKNYNLKYIKQVKLPDNLREISGLAVTDDGRVFSHNDEKGIVYQIDYSNGKVIKRFAIGDPIPKRDFEGIAIVKDKFYLVVSSGDIYEFKEADDKKSSKYKIYKTGLTSSYNIEGLCYDPLTNSLLAACKGYPGKNYNGYRAVYSFNLKERKLEPKPRFLLSLKNLDKKYDMKNFSPSAIERNPKTGNFFILSSHVRALIEVSPDGKILDGISFSEKKHKQPEGITFLPDMKMLISDEGRGGHGTVTTYKLKD
jgi:uncharacterized protein YjiK